jgi:hypothetical protein
MSRSLEVLSVTNRVLFLGLIAISVVLTGCAMNNQSPSTASHSALLTVSGTVHGGQQPVSGSTIQLFAANTSANQGASISMLTNPVTTAGDGTFTITSDYTCPTSNPLVYIVSTGGNPGLPGSVNNTDIALMALLGTCNTLYSGTVVNIDELTTVASVTALSSFMTDYAHVGSAPTNPTAMAGAFDAAISMVDFSTGQIANGAATDETPQLQVNTLADIIAACVNTAGGTSGDGTPCGKLFSYAGGGSDTVKAALLMTQSPGTNTTQLYALIGALPPFQPYFTSAPTDLTSTAGVTFPVNVQTGALDSNGHVWLYTGGYTYNTVTDTSTDLPGVITVYDGNFNPLFTVSPGSGGLYYPYTMAADASGHVFAVNSNDSISEFASNGSPISPSGGWNTGLVSGFSTSGSGDSYVAPYDISGLKIDAQGNIWGNVPGGSGSCYLEMNSSGTVITPNGNFCTGLGTTDNGPEAVDGSGNAWLIGSNEISKVNASGNLAATAPSSQGCFYTRANGNTLGDLEGETMDLLYDHVNNHVWGYSTTGAGTVTNAGAANFCDVGSTTLPVMPTYASTATTAGSPYSSGSLLISSAALDGAGNLWFITEGIARSGIVGSSAGDFTGTINYASYLGEIGANGTLLTPYNTTTNTYGLQPAGLGVNASATATNSVAGPTPSNVGLLGIDNLGNIWALDTQSNKLLKITGLAVANTVNY